ncbi:MAG TPA: hypothetical protein VK631_15125, partial [Solirubrobacteraceae bacterium]|nr:hypothetical protein [Solirubrobacteraceae bacterium]
MWQAASRWTALVAAGASLLVFSRIFGGEGAAQLLGEEGIAVAIGRALQGIGTLCAIAAGAWIGAHRRTRTRACKRSAAPTTSAAPA